MNPHLKNLLKKIEELPKSIDSLSIWDIDDTLFESETSVFVIKDNKIVKKLSTSEYNSYRPKLGENFDFSEFRDSNLFFHHAKPLSANLRMAKESLEKKNNFFMVLTARADFNDKNLILRKFEMYGLEMNKPTTHIVRSGNLGLSTAAGKKEVIAACLNTKRRDASAKFKTASLYDDDKRNLDAFLSLKSSVSDIKYETFIIKNGHIQFYKEK